MLRKISKKGESLSTNKIITIVLVLVVLAAVLLYVFRVKVNEWVQNLPGYGSQEDKELDYTQLSPEEQARLNIDCFGNIKDCGKTWFFESDCAEILINHASTGLYWYYERGEGPISKSFGSTNIGYAGLSSAPKKIISINWASASGSGISNEYLQKLDGAEIKGNTICRPKETVK